MGSLIALASGMIFGIGLIAGGMSDPAKVRAFLDLFGAWAPSLALVMAGAVAVGMPAFARAGTARCRGAARTWKSRRAP